MSEVILQDQEILDLTTQVNDGEYTKFKITLPGTERVVTSENMRRSDIKAGVLIAWCESIREQMHIDYESNRKEMETKRQARIKREDAEREKAAQAAVEVAGEASTEDLDSAIILPAVEQETASEEPKLILPNTVQGETTQAKSNQDSLWQAYGNLLGELEKVKARLRAMGEQV